MSDYRFPRVRREEVALDIEDVSSGIGGLFRTNWMRQVEQRLRDIINVRTAVECHIAWLAAQPREANELGLLSER